MANRTITLSDGLYDYLLDVSLREPDVLRRLRDETAKIPAAAMQIAREQGQFVALLVEVMGARSAIEVGRSPATAASASPLRCRRAGASSPATRTRNGPTWRGATGPTPASRTV